MMTQILKDDYRDLKTGLHRLKLISIIVFLFLMSFVSGAQAMDADLWSVPQFPQSEIIWKDRWLEINGISARATHLSCPVQPKEVLEFYAQTLKSQGWEIDGENSYIDSNIVNFKKDGRFLYVAIFGQNLDGGCQAYIISSPQSLTLCPQLSSYFLQEEMAPDNAGRDFSEIPRLPGSKRRLNIFSQEQGNWVSYEAAASLEEVVSFYQENLKTMGWKLISSFSADALKRFVKKAALDIDPADIDAVSVLFFERGNESLAININYITAPKTSRRCLITIASNLNRELNPGKVKEE